MFFNCRQRRSELFVEPTQSVCIVGLLLRKSRLEHQLRIPSYLVEGLTQCLEIPIGGVQLGDFPLIELLLARKLDKVLGRFAIRRRKRAQAGADVTELLGLLGQVLDGSLCGPDTIGIRIQRPRAFSQ